MTVNRLSRSYAGEICNIFVSLSDKLDKEVCSHTCIHKGSISVMKTLLLWTVGAEIVGTIYLSIHSGEL